MKKLLNTAFIYALAAMAGGVFYREFTKFNGFSGRTALGLVHTHLFLLGRVVYLPLYRFGVTGLRTAAWMLSLVGLGMTLYALFT